MAVGFVVALCGVLVAAGYQGWRALMRYFVRQYYEGSYEPVVFSAEIIDGYPAEHHLDNVPWIATEIPVCQSNSLQMIAAQRGIERPRRHFDFLMGFTYGAGEIPGGLGFFPGTDPETGFVIAAPYLGLVRRYWVTNDETLYLQALRHYIAQGYPLRVALDMGVLYGAKEQLPHSEVLVGYDQDGFYYYESVCIVPASCEPGRRPPGDKGLYVSAERLLAAVDSQAKMFDYPWRYSLTVFEPGPLKQDLGPVWSRNGQSLMGGVQYGPRQGADVIDGLADEIERRGARLDLSEIRPGLEAAIYFRRDNATYLREAFPGQAEVEHAATLFDQAADDYEAALSAMEDGLADPMKACRVAAWLHQAAVAEREVGAIMMARGQ